MTKAELIEFIEGLEWISIPVRINEKGMAAVILGCPKCKQAKRDGHAEGCEMQKVVGK
jgi:hypothetical protein